MEEITKPDIETSRKQETIPDIEIMRKYLDHYNALCDFVLSRQVLKTLLLYWKVGSIVLAILALVIGIIGGRAYINYIVDQKVQQLVAESINQERTYLTKRSNIASISDDAFVKYTISSYDDLNRIANDPQEDSRIRMSAKAEINRLRVFFSSTISDEIVPEIDIECKEDDTKGYDISTDALIHLYSDANSLGKRTTIISMLGTKEGDKNKVVQFLLQVARATDNLKIRYIALTTVQRLINDYTGNPFSFKDFEDTAERLTK